MLFCKDCKHLEWHMNRATAQMTVPVCSHPSVVTAVDPVTGAVIQLDPSAYSTRDVGADCGPEARLFEARD